MHSKLRMVKIRKPLFISLLLTVVLLSGCMGGQTVAAPTATPTPAPTATPTPAPTPTPTPEPEREEAAADATAVPTPQLTLPAGFAAVDDEPRGYTIGLPNGWTQLDLRSARFQGMASTLGLGDSLAPLNEFLETPGGDMIGLVAITDLAGMMFGGLPTLLNVSVIDAPGQTPDALLTYLQSAIESNGAALGDISIESLETATINNLPAVEGDAVADLSNVGMDAVMYAKVVALIANDKVYVLTLLTESGNRSAKQAEFTQIIGAFGPQ